MAMREFVNDPNGPLDRETFIHIIGAMLVTLGYTELHLRTIDLEFFYAGGAPSLSVQMMPDGIHLKLISREDALREGNNG